MKRRIINRLITGCIILLCPAFDLSAQVCFTTASYSTGLQPTAIANADFNVDGYKDIIVSNFDPSSNSVSLLAGQSNGNFSAAINLSVGNGPVSLTTGDFNNDNQLDIVTANQTSNNLSILFNLGGLTFSAASSYSLSLSPTAITSSDMNNDGNQDLIVGMSTSVAVLLGNGSGSFTTFTTVVLGSPSALFIDDFNADGKKDVACTNSASNNLKILLGSGNGSFSSQNTFTTGTNPRSITGGDFNADGKIDLAVGNASSLNVSVFIGNGTGSFATAVNYAVSSGPYSIINTDLNGDTKIDLATSNIGGLNISVLAGTGSGTFGTATSYSIGTAGYSLTYADFNSDGKQDLATANKNANNAYVLLNATPYLNITGNTLNCPGNNTTLKATGATSYTWSANAGGATIDSVVVSPSITTTYTVTGLLGCTRTKTVTVTVPTLSITGTTTLCSGGTTTLNGSSASSYTWLPANINTSSLSISPTSSATYTLLAINNGCSLSKTVTVNVTATPTLSISGSSMTCAGNSVTLSASGGSTYTWNPGNIHTSSITISPFSSVAYTLTSKNGSCVGTKTTSVTVPFSLGFASSVNYACGANPRSICTADFNLDGKPDLATANWGSNTISIFLGTGSGAFGSATSVGVGVNPGGICSGDFNRDGKPDIAVTNITSGTLTLLFGTGTGTFGPTANYVAGSQPSGVCTTDINNDGFLDIVCTNIVSNNISVFIGNGLGSFGAGVKYSTDVNPEYVLACDVDGNGYKDLITTNYGSNNISVFLNANGVLTAPTTYSASSQPLGIASGDFNNDNFPDLAVANVGNNNVSIFLNTGAGTFAPANNYIGGSMLSSITAFYFNGDAYLDLAISNEGTGAATILLGQGNGSFNSPVSYTTGNKAESIISEDLNLDGKIDLAVANFNASTVSVLINSSTLLNISGNTNVCLGNSTTLTALGANTYTWSANAGGVNTSSVIVSPSSNTTYTVSTDSLGCSNVATATVKIQGPPITVTSSGIICGIGSATLTASGVTSYTWSANAGSAIGSTVIVTPTVSTVYTVTGSSIGCNSASTQTVLVTVIPSPTVTVSASDSIICNGSGSVLSGHGAMLYFWSSNANSSNSPTVAVTPNATSTYTVTGDNGAGCTSTATITVNVTANPTPNIITYAGTGLASSTGNGGAAISAGVHKPTALVSRSNQLYLADEGNGSGTIRKIDKNTGTINLITQGAGGTGPYAIFYYSYGLAIDSVGNIFYSDGGASRILDYTTSGSTNKVAGEGSCGNPLYCGDGGPASNCVLNKANGVAFDKSGNLYIADTYNSRVRKIDKQTGIITTIAGNGVAGYGGDNGLATSANLYYPSQLVFDKNGNLYISDDYVNLIRKVNTAGIITTVAGDVNNVVYGANGYSGDGGPATKCNLNDPEGLAIDVIGNLYIADTKNNRIRKVDTTGVISTVAGMGTAGFSGDNGLATLAQLNAPIAVAADSSYLYIADELNNRIRRVTLSYCSTPISMQVSADTVICEGGSANLYVSGASSYVWWHNGLTSNSVTVSPSTTTFYTVTGTSGVCNLTKKIKVTVIPTVQISGVTNICSGDTTILTGNNAFTYTWSSNSGGGNNVTVSLSPSATTTYTLSGTNSGCVSSTSLSIMVSNCSPNACSNNLDFHTGNLSSWSGKWNNQGSSGYTSMNITTLDSAGHNKMGHVHEICTSGTDPHVSSISRVAPGHNYSIRLGNDSAWSNYYNASNWPYNHQTVSDTILVDANNCSLNFWYAFIFSQDASGSEAFSNQPKFKIRIFDSNNAIINAGSLDVTTNQFFSPDGLTNFYYKGWTHAAVNLSNYIGQKVKITFESMDCLYGDHCGYAYITPECGEKFQINQSNTGVCNNSSTILSAPQGYTSYLWSGPGIVGSATSYSIAVNTAGFYSVKITDYSGTSYTLSTTLSVATAPISSFTVNNGCLSDTSFFSNTSTGTSLLYSWNFGDGNVAASSAPSHVYSSSGVYTVNLVCSNTCGSDTATAQVTIFQHPLLSAISNQVKCAGNSTDSINYITTPSGGSVQWINTNSAIGLTVSGTGNILPFVCANVSSSQTAIITATATANGCSSSPFAFSITVNPLPNTTVIGDSLLCMGDSTTLNAGGASAYLWMPGNVSGPSVTVSPTASTSYTVTGANLNCFSSAIITVTVNPIPNLLVSGSNTICTNDTVLLTASGANTYTWNPSNNNNDSILVVPNSTTVYTVTATVGTCTTDAVIPVFVDQCVWPGDADEDLSVTSLDLLPIGIKFGTSGSPRSSINNNWNGYPCLNWNDTLVSGINTKYVDCNGDGLVGFLDTAAITLNYGQSHLAKYASTQSVSEFSFIFDKPFYQAGDTVTANIVLGSATNPLFNFYGVAFTLTYDYAKIVPGSERFYFLNGWSGVINQSQIKFSKLTPGIVEASEVRITHTDTAGYGQIATLKYILQNPLSDCELIHTIVNSTKTNYLGTYSMISNMQDSVPVTNMTTAYGSPKNRSLVYWPNPTKDIMSIEYFKKVDYVEVLNALGEKVQVEYPYSKNFSIDLRGQIPGLYIIRFEGAVIKALKE